MTDFISQFMSNLFQGNVILATIIISMIPLIELKGAIPFATSEAFWGEIALNSWEAFLYAFIGNVIITIILALIFKPIYNAIKDKKFFKSIVNFFTNSIKQKSNEIENNNQKSENKKIWIKLITVFCFVAIPIPGTGVYTGTCLAILLGLNFKQTVASVTLGNLIAGIIIATICSIFPAFTDILFYIFIAIIIAFLIYKLIVHFSNKNKQVADENTENNNEK